MNRCLLIAVMIMAAVFSLSCSGGSIPVLPDSNAPGYTAGQEIQAYGGTSKALWGAWEIGIDTTTWEVSITPIRGVQFTVDVVTFLQPPVGNITNLSIEVTDVADWFTLGLIGVDVGLRHPFPGLDEYTGFDVLGVFVAPGSVGGQYDGDVIYTNGDDEPILLNADGYTRWMNPVEFPDTGTILDFTPGALGSQDIGLFTSTINAHKYFADGLEKDEDVGEFFADLLNTDARGTFRPGSFNEREYDLKFPMVDDSPYLVFQYAVVASWIEPDTTLSGDPDALDVPGDFALSANADEAIFIDVTDNSSLYYADSIGGGDINLELEVYDWGALQSSANVADEIFQIVVEGDSSVIPGGYVAFDQTTLAASAAPGTTAISSVFQIDITGCTPQSGDDVPLLITVESFAPDTFDPGTGTPMNADSLAAYFFTDVEVGTEVPWGLEVISPNGGETLWMAMSHEITWDPGPGGITDVKIEWSTDNFISDVQLIIDSTENDGSFTWEPIPNVETTTARIRITDVASPESDKSDDDFTIALPVWLNTEDPVIADNGTVAFSWWPHYHWGDEFSPALAQATNGTVWVIWCNNNSQTNDTQIHSSDGTYWSGTGNCFGTSGPNYRADRYKVAPGQDTYVYCLLNPFLNGMTAMNRLYYAAWNYNFNAGSTQTNYEIAIDQAGYIYAFTDGGSGISITRSSNPNNASSCGSWGSVTSNGEISHVRSWCRVGDGLAFAWFNTSGEIRVSLTTDAPTNQTWDSGDVVFDGTGYTNVEHPALDIDPDGRLYCCFTARNSSTSEYELLFSRRETDGTWTDLVLAISSTDPIEDAHIQYTDVDDYEVVLIVYETNGQVHYVISPSAGNVFLPIGDISPATEDAYDPDMIVCAPQYGFDVVSFYAFDDGTGSGDVAWVNADFETQ